MAFVSITVSKMEEILAELSVLVMVLISSYVL